MRLTLSAVLCAALLASPALAHDRHASANWGGHNGPPPGADFPPPPPYGYDGYDGPVEPRWEQDQARFHDEWRERCRERDDRDTPHDCGQPAPYGYYPGAYMGHAVPMIMVPVLRNKPCKEVVEYVEERVVVPARRVIRPRARIMPDKRVRIVPDKRVPMTPTKRIPY